jgi:hypothetical protein
MSSQHRGGGKRPRPLTADERAGLTKLGLQRLTELRAERAEAASNGHAPAPLPHKAKNRRAVLARFASGIARAEFGRFYWDEHRNSVPNTRRRPKPNRANGRQATAKERTGNPPRH